MRLLALSILLILALPMAAAHDGWYYAGDTFVLDGTAYSVEGSGPESVLLGVGGRLFLMSLYECKEDGYSEYCYTESAYPDDESHIKYAAGEELYGYRLSITSSSPEVSAEREFSTTSPELGDVVEATVTLENTGDYTVHDFTYEETLPPGLTLVSGPGVGGKISFKVTTLPFGQQTRFKYRVRPDRFGEYTLTPNVTYVFDGKKHSLSVSAQAFKVEMPLSVWTYITPTLSLDKTGKYLVNITNDGESEAFTVDLAATIPEGMQVQGMSGFMGTGNLTAHFTLGHGDEKRLGFDFITTKGGGLPVVLNVTVQSTGVSASQAYTSTVSSSDDRLEPTITVFPSNPPYFAGSEIVVSGVLENKKPGLRFDAVKGALSSDLFAPATFGHGTFLPGEKRTEATATITLPNASGTHTVTFAGTYRSPAGRPLEFSASKDITVDLRVSSVGVSWALEPQAPERGSNVTVTVTVENTYGKYLTFDVHDQYPEGIEKIGGLTYAETSLEKDASQQVYLYQLRIPEDFPDDRIAITTVVKAKDQPFPEEYGTEIRVAGARDDGAAAVPEPEPAVVDAEPEKKQLGFFAAIWDFLKGLFD